MIGTRGNSLGKQKQLFSHKAGGNRCSPGPSSVKVTHCHSLDISHKLISVRADDMNLWLKDSAKKLGMNEPESRRQRRMPVTPPRSSFASVTAAWAPPVQLQQFQHKIHTEIWSHDDSNRHQLWACSLSVFPNITQVVFLLLWQFSLRILQYVCPGHVIHTSSQTPRLEPSLLLHEHVLRVWMLLWVLLCKWSKMKTIKARTKPETRAF